MSDNTTDTTNPETTEQALGPDQGVDQPDAPEVNDTTADDRDHDGDHGDITKARREAARLRQRAKDAETQRDTLTVQLAAQQRAIVNHLAEQLSVHPDLLDAAGLDVTTLLDDNGMVNVDAAAEYIEATAKRFRVIRGHQPNPAQGAGSGHMPRTPQLRDAFASQQRPDPYSSQF